MPEKTERVDPLAVFNIHFVTKHQKIAGEPFGEFFFEKKVSHSRKYSKGVSFGPLSFLDAVKILLRKLSKNCKNCKNCKKSGPFRVSDCRLKKNTHCNNRAFFP